MNPNVKLTERFSVVPALAAVVPSTAAPKRISLKNALRVTVLILVKNATTVTGSAITLKQSTTVAGGGEKALSFSKVSRSIDTDASELLDEVAVVSNTFTTDATNSKNLLYVIDVLPESLDINNGFDVLGVGVGDATAATVSVAYVVHRKTGGTPTTMLTD